MTPTRDEEKSRRLLELDVELSLVRDERQRLKEREREINAQLAALVGIKVDDVVPDHNLRPSGARIKVRNVVAQAMPLADSDVNYLNVQGAGSPITKGGKPSKSVRHAEWRHLCRDVWYTGAEFERAVKAATPKFAVAYAVLHRPTGHYLPDVPGNFTSSVPEPLVPGPGHAYGARLTTNWRAAVGRRSSYVKGETHTEREWEDAEGTLGGGFHYQSEPRALGEPRNRDDYEVVAFELRPIPVPEDRS